MRSNARDRLLDRLKAEPGYEHALAAALGDDLEAGLDREADRFWGGAARQERSEEHTSELQSLMRISYAVFCLEKKNSMSTQQDNLPNYHHNTVYNKPTHY